jgi:hypothetical protein
VQVEPLDYEHQDSRGNQEHDADDQCDDAESAAQQPEWSPGHDIVVEREARELRPREESTRGSVGRFGHRA